MGINNFIDEYELFYFHEFINIDSFSEEKKGVLENDSGIFFIKNDYTIYQKKTIPYDQITKADQRFNYGTFLIMLFNLPFEEVEDFLQFHFDKYTGDKKKFLTHVYHEFKGSKSTQGGVEIPPPQQKVILLNWCEQKMAELKPGYIMKKSKDKEPFVDLLRIKELGEIKNNSYDLSKLIRMLEELNNNYDNDNYYSVAIISRAIIDHVPPIFGIQTFTNLIHQKKFSRSFLKSMNHLNETLRSIGDSFLHQTIRENEVLPNKTQVNFSQDLDILLTEIIRILK